MPSSFRVLVIGGGIAGLAAAVGLLRQGHKVTVLERTPNLQTTGGSILLSPNAARVIDDYGLLAQYHTLDEKSEKHLIFNHSGKLLDVIDHTAIEKRYGYSIPNLSRKAQQRILYEAVLKEGGEVRFGCRVKEVDEQAPAVVLESNERIEADLIVGADGIRSTIRRLGLGPNDRKPIPDSLGFQCQMSLDRLRADPLASSLLEDHSIKSWWGPHRHVIGGPKVEDGIYGLGLFIQGPALEGIDLDISVPNRGVERRGDLALLRKHAQVFEPKVRAFFDLVEQEKCSLWFVAYVPHLPTWNTPSGKVTLLGDAAHAVVPHIGQGAASSIEDGACLALCVSHAKTTQEIPAALRIYEKLRKPRTEKIGSVARTSGEYKGLEDGPAQRRRDKGFAERLDKNSAKYEASRSYSHLDWLYGYDVFKTTKEELDRVGPLSDRARL